jgi:hypothetical protein
MPQGGIVAVDAQGGRMTRCLSYQRVLALRRQLFRTLPAQMAWSRSRPGVLVYRHGHLTVAVNFLRRAVNLEIKGRLLIGSRPLVSAREGRVHLPGNSGAWLDNVAPEPPAIRGFVARLSIPGSLGSLLLIENPRSYR